MERKFMQRLLICFFLASAFAAGQQPAAPKAKSAPAKTAATEDSLPSEETVDAFLRATWGYNPTLSWKVASIKPSKAQGLTEITVAVSTPQGPQTSKFFVTPDGQHAVVGDIIPFGAHPFDPLRKELEKRMTGPSRGPASATVTLVEFSDLQCPHCKAAQPVLDKLLAENPNVRLIFQNFPLPNHDWAAKAAAYSDCIGHQSNDAFWKFIQAVYDAQGEITQTSADEKLNAIADQSGVKGSEIAACAAKDVTVGRVQGSLSLGQAVGVTGTPTLYINGRPIHNVGQVSYEELKSLVDFAATDK
jgi:protein-disulfide isomerase